MATAPVLDIHDYHEYAPYIEHDDGPHIVYRNVYTLILIFLFQSFFKYLPNMIPLIIYPCLTSTI